jgi:hypothetical protein
MNGGKETGLVFLQANYPRRSRVNLPLSESDIAFEQFLQELPEDYDQLAREFKAFSRARKIKTPA